MRKSAVLLIGFGGPTKMEEVKPFLESVLKGIRIPQERFDEVMHHYEVIGGVSPYNAITEKQKEALEKELKKRGVQAPVFTGLRHSTPSLHDAVCRLQKEGSEQVVGFVLASLRSYASFEKYTERFEEAKSHLGLHVPVVYTKAFHTNPLFIKAQSQKALSILKNFSEKQKDGTYFIFTAHSIPQAMSDQSGYAAQFEESSDLAAKNLGLQNWCVAYQSRSGNPRDPWLEPSVISVIEKLDKQKFKNVFLIPIGFLCDNVEVIYDLDCEAKEAAESLGLNYFRAQTVTDEPYFIQMVADLIEDTMNGSHP